MLPVGTTAPSGQGLPLLETHDGALAVLLLDIGYGEVDGLVAILVVH